jgi:hypothetical protein
VTARGVVFDTIANPTTSSGITIDSSGLGSFVSTITGLTPLTTYYVRAYATNSLGTAYGNVVNFSTPLTIGSFYSGGIVFHIDGTGQHGFVCAPSDQGSHSWGCPTTNINTSLGVGTGQANTNLILSGCGQRPIAASVCADLVLNGYDDWFLPSRDELGLMRANLYTQGIGNFARFCTNHYWSSSQFQASSAWYVVFNNPSYSGDASKNRPTDPFCVRAIRAF